MQTHSVHVSAEAYAIDVDIAWPDDQFEGLDFGAFKVADKQESTLELVNGGKYDVGYKVLCRKQPLRDILAISPSEGVLAPGGERQRALGQFLRRQCRSGWCRGGRRGRRTNRTMYSRDAGTGGESGDPPLEMKIMKRHLHVMYCRRWVADGRWS